MKSHPILGKLAFQNRLCRAAHPRMAIGGSAFPPWAFLHENIIRALCKNCLFYKPMAPRRVIYTYFIAEQVTPKVVDWVRKFDTLACHQVISLTHDLGNGQTIFSFFPDNVFIKLWILRSLFLLYHRTNHLRYWWQFTGKTLVCHFNLKRLYYTHIKYIWYIKCSQISWHELMCSYELQQFAAAFIQRNWDSPLSFKVPCNANPPSVTLPLYMYHDDHYNMIDILDPKLSVIVPLYCMLFVLLVEFTRISKVATCYKKGVLIENQSKLERYVDMSIRRLPSSYIIGLKSSSVYYSVLPIYHGWWGPSNGTAI